MVVPRFAGWDGTARGFFTLAGAAILCARLLSACRAGRLPPSAGRSPDGCSVHRAADRRVPPTRPRPRLMARLPLLGSRVDVGEATPQFPMGEPWRANMPNLFQALANSPTTWPASLAWRTISRAGRSLRGPRADRSHHCRGYAVRVWRRGARRTGARGGAASGRIAAVRQGDPSTARRPRRSASPRRSLTARSVPAWSSLEFRSYRESVATSPGGSKADCHSQE
jgi:hypothetical protein